MIRRERLPNRQALSASLDRFADAAFGADPEMTRDIRRTIARAMLDGTVAPEPLGVDPDAPAYRALRAARLRGGI